jgi:hypothetical protein
MSVANCFEYGLTLQQPAIGFNQLYTPSVGQVLTLANGSRVDVITIDNLSKGVYIADGYIRITAVDDDAIGTNITIYYQDTTGGGGLKNTAIFGADILDGSNYLLPIKYTFSQTDDTEQVVQLQTYYTSTGSLETDDWYVNVWKIA